MSRRRNCITAIAVCAALAATAPTAAQDTHAAPSAALEPIPRDLEIRWALSAAPPHIRNDATVWVLDPSEGYVVAQRGESGLECLVSRTAPEQGVYRDDVYVPLCYDTPGAVTYLKVLRDAAAMRAAGTGAAALKAEFVRRYADGTYAPPTRPGLSYMVAPVIRTWALPDGEVHTVSMPHVMTYAPGVTDESLGSMQGPTFTQPFAFQEGVPEQGYIIQTVGLTEERVILAENADLLAELCAYRAELCLPDDTAAAHPHRAQRNSNR